MRRRGAGSCADREPEPPPVDRLDELGASELAAYGSDVHVEHLGRPVPVATPDAREHLASREHAARVGRETREDVELARRQSDVVAIHGNAMRADVDAERTDLLNRL